MSGFVLCWDCEKVIDPGTWGAECPTCNEKSRAETETLRASLAAAVERAERAERERDEWRHRCGCTPECELHCCSQDCDNAGAEEASWRGAWDLLDEARSALSRAEALEGALRDLLCVWWPSTEEGHTGFVDRLGMQFYYETRIWPPFKSAPLEMCVASTDEERMAASKAWRDWLEQKRFAAADKARSLLSSPPPTKDAPAEEPDHA